MVELNFAIFIKNCDRKKVFEELREQGIGVNVHYIPVYQHPYYQKCGYKDVHCENAEKIYSQMISLPLYPALTSENQQYVIQKVKQCVQQK